MPFVIASLFVVSTVVQQTVPAPVPVATPIPEKKICRTQQSTGSIMPGKRTCHTHAEWQQIDAANADNADQFRNRSRTTGTRGF